MSEPTHSNPVAVPWTPEIAGQTAPVPAPVPTPQGQHPAPAKPIYQPQPNQNPVQNPIQNQGQYSAQGPQPYSRQTHVAQSAPQMPPHQPPATQSQYPQPQQPQPQSVYAAAPIPNAPQQPHANQASQPYSQMPQTHGQNQGQPFQSPTQHMRLPQMAQAQMRPQQEQHGLHGHMPPQLAPHMQPAPEQVQGGMAQNQHAGTSNSLLGKLLKRSPKPQLTAQNASMGAAQPAPAESLFNKNFALGAVAGIVFGAFVLPMLLNTLFGKDTPAQAQYQNSQAMAEVTAPALPELNVNPAMTSSETGQSFLDAAIKADAPQ